MVVFQLSVAILGKPEDVRVEEESHYDSISSADSDSEVEGDSTRRRKTVQGNQSPVFKL